ncbi:alpha-amylase family glycosyl hydrolase [Niveibacterium sp. COAC-50]|uniref:alpha-amylase family glycosyl hydrolase n=1 Tax=Niveibacterium sp. COAC-50 TaxID=2729384 RepID=UPI001C12F3D5|nr:alpha-amylase family glycosyl hydrolase [Niveibacterium sp. COAC-50]
MRSCRRSLILALLASALMAACGGGSDASKVEPQSGQLDLSPVAVAASPSALPDGWYRDAVFVEIYVRGYQDSDGDGQGDIDGLISRLDYLAELGVKGIWLMPVFASGDHDHGYGVADYRKIETEFGGEAALKRLIDAAHARGIGVLLDYVMNHSSSSNPLFHDSTYGLENKRDWYMWRREDPGWSWWVPSPWRRLNNAYYYAPFDVAMPDFDLTNEAVVSYHIASMRKWLNLGVDGFRMDAVQNFIENDYLTENQPETFALLKRLHDELDKYPNRFMVCEDVPAPEYAAQNGCGSAFFFGLHSALVASARDGVVDSKLGAYLASPALPQMSTILTNHDTFAGDRLFNQFGGDEAKYKLAIASLLTLPGTPFIYYGDEIGISLATKESGSAINHDHQLRPPMSWTADAKTAGFTTGSPFRSLADNSAAYNVASQHATGGSIYATYKQLIALRNGEAALRRGDITPIASGSASVLAFTRVLGGEKLLVVINYGDAAAELSLTTPGGNATWNNRYPGSAASLISDATGVVSFKLPARSAQVYKLAP